MMRCFAESNPFHLNKLCFLWTVYFVHSFVSGGSYVLLSRLYVFMRLSRSLNLQTNCLEALWLNLLFNISTKLNNKVTPDGSLVRANVKWYLMIKPPACEYMIIQFQSLKHVAEWNLTKKVQCVLLNYQWSSMEKFIFPCMLDINSNMSRAVYKLFLVDIHLNQSISDI